MGKGGGGGGRIGEFAEKAAGSHDGFQCPLVLLLPQPQLPSLPPSRGPRLLRWSAAGSKSTFSPLEAGFRGELGVCASCGLWSSGLLPAGGPFHFEGKVYPEPSLQNR